MRFRTRVARPEASVANHSNSQYAVPYRGAFVCRMPWLINTCLRLTIDLSGLYYFPSRLLPQQQQQATVPA